MQTAWRPPHHIVVEGGRVVIDGLHQAGDLMVEDGDESAHLRVQVLPLTFAIRHLADHARKAGALLDTLASAETVRNTVEPYRRDSARSPMSCTLGWPPFILFYFYFLS